MNSVLITTLFVYVTGFHCEATDDVYGNVSVASRNNDKSERLDHVIVKHKILTVVRDIFNDLMDVSSDFNITNNHLYRNGNFSIKPVIFDKVNLTVVAETQSEKYVYYNILVPEIALQYDFIFTLESIGVVDGEMKIIMKNQMIILRFNVLPTMNGAYVVYDTAQYKHDVNDHEVIYRINNEAISNDTLISTTKFVIDTFVKTIFETTFTQVIRTNLENMNITLKLPIPTPSVPTTERPWKTLYSKSTQEATFTVPISETTEPTWPTFQPWTTRQPRTTFRPEPWTTLRPEPRTTFRPKPQTTFLPEPWTTFRPKTTLKPWPTRGPVSKQFNCESVKYGRDLEKRFKEALKVNVLRVPDFNVDVNDPGCQCEFVLSDGVFNIGNEIEYWGTKTQRGDTGILENVDMVFEIKDIAVKYKINVNKKVGNNKQITLEVILKNTQMEVTEVPDENKKCRTTDINILIDYVYEFHPTFNKDEDPEFVFWFKEIMDRRIRSPFFNTLNQGKKNTMAPIVTYLNQQ